MSRKFAHIVDGQVVNIILAGADWAASAGQLLVDVTDNLAEPGVGWSYDGIEFSPPPVPQPPAFDRPRHITQLAFISRFTDAEAVAIDLASIGATQQAASVRRYQKKVDAATYIDLDREDTRAGVQALEAAGLLAAGRALQILDAPVQESERFKG